MTNAPAILAFVTTAFAVTAAQAAVVTWEPTNADVNYVLATVDSGFTLAMFDVTDFDGGQLSPLNLDLTNETVVIAPATGADFSATNTAGDSIILVGDSQFVVALGDGTTWFEPTDWTQPGPSPTIYDITFANGTVLSIDAVPTPLPPAEIPEPASAWLVASSLLGLVGFARRHA